MLNQIPSADTVPHDISGKTPHDIELMPSWEYLPFLVRKRVVLYDVRKTPTRQNVLPQICSPVTVRYGRIARTAVTAAVDLPLKLRAHADLLAVRRKMHKTPPEHEQHIPRTPVPPVLIHSVIHVLPALAVLQLYRDYGYAVQEYAQV